MTRSLALVLVIGSLPALAGNKVIQNDTFTGVGSVNAGISFNEYQGVGVMFEPPLAEYPLTVVGVDIFCVPYMNQGNGVGSYLVDLYDETSMTPAPRPDDAGVWPDFVMTNGRLGQTGAALTASTTTFDRFTFSQPITIASGRVFIQVTQQNSTTGSGGNALADNTTIALDNATSTRPGANWFFDGFGVFHPFVQGDGGTYMGLNRNWIVRLVLRVPDVQVTVTSISPNTITVGTSTTVVISGTNFELGAKALLGTTELPITNLTGTGISATVSGLGVGVYDVKVRNLSGVEGVLPNGFTVLSADGGAPTGGGTGGGGTGGGTGGAGGGTGGGTGNEALGLTAITPTQTYEEDATALFLTGAGFKAGARVLVGGTRVEGAVVESGGVISAALVANLLPPGKYDVSVINLNGEQATLPQAFTVLAGSRAAPKGCSCSQLEGVVALLAIATLMRRRNRTGA